MANQLTDFQTIFNILSGLIPALIWWFFWVGRDRTKAEPMGLIAMCVLMGGIAVLMASPMQKLLNDMITDPTAKIIAFASIEEFLKFGGAALVALNSDYNNEPIAPAVYLISCALGFAALENILYIFNLSQGFVMTASLLTGTFRFFGATLLHVVATGFIGITLGLAPQELKKFFTLFGLAGAIFLHTAFNFFIIKDDTASFLQIYGYLWIAAIISVLTLQKLKRISPGIVPA